MDRAKVEQRVLVVIYTPAAVDILTRKPHTQNSG